MPPNHRLDSIELEKQESCETLIPRLLLELGTPYKVAVQLGVYPNTIRYWLHKHGYRSIKSRWEKTSE